MLHVILALEYEKSRNSCLGASYIYTYLRNVYFSY